MLFTAAQIKRICCATAQCVLIGCARISVLLGSMMLALAIGHVGSHALCDTYCCVWPRLWDVTTLSLRTLLSSNLLLLPFCPSSLCEFISDVFRLFDSISSKHLIVAVLPQFDRLSFVLPQFQEGPFHPHRGQAPLLPHRQLGQQCLTT